ncbi:ATP-dependent Clp protease ATP-binding subunit [Ectothiorhodospiraceae bacterium WFHF3C12]|nr:ATP-dependent Clp protease ATP-binding subunit [Ectothiorhodospiraceae bacterium WFHF3C12]
MPFINDVLADNQAQVASQAVGSRAGDPEAGAAGNTVSRFRFDPDAVAALLRRRIVGQDHVLDDLESALRVVKADIADPGRPLYVALFLGPTGVGKTEVVRVLSEAIHGSPDAFCRIDMNTLSQEHYAAALTGAPPGYVGSKEGTTLLDPARIEGSFSEPGIVLFDEVEKASREVTRALLNVFETGMLTLTSGARSINFRNALIFMTSNLGAQRIHSYEHSCARGWRRYLPMTVGRRHRAIERIIDQSLQSAFEPEFINRIDSLTRFHWIERNAMDALIDLELDKLNGRLRRIGREVSLEHDLRDLLRRQGFDRRFGARSMRRAMRRFVEVPLASALMGENLVKRDGADLQTLVGRVVNGDVVFEIRA